jgi:3',5'-nucleoside bisphosphate phosphatase
MGTAAISGGRPMTMSPHTGCTDASTVAEYVDLHIHTFHSGGGQHSVEEIFDFAAAAGLRAFAISDHDSVAALPRACELAPDRGVEFVPSIELTADHEGRELHVLGPFVERTSPALIEALDRMSRMRFEQALERIARLRRLRFEITYEEAASRCHGSIPSGTALAAVILDRHSRTRDPRLEPYISGERSDRPEIHFYQDFIGRGAPAHVPRQWMPVTEALELLLRCGAVPVLAHPGAGVFGAGERLIARLKEAGLKGLEVFTSYHDAKASHYYLNLASKLRLIPTAGSDFHGRIKPHVAFGSVRSVGPELIRVLESCRREPGSPQTGN